MKKLCSIAVLILALLTTKASGKDFNYIFEKGMGGYNCFRIPAIVKAKNGSLVAFAEARKKSCSDTEILIW